jgi:plastocyanin
MYEHRFMKPGTFRYHCMVHPNMFGTVVVEKK